jgi:hypothetical protein
LDFANSVRHRKPVTSNTQVTVILPDAVQKVLYGLLALLNNLPECVTLCRLFDAIILSLILDKSSLEAFKLCDDLLILFRKALAVFEGSYQIMYQTDATHEVTNRETEADGHVNRLLIVAPKTGRTRSLTSHG